MVKRICNLFDFVADFSDSAYLYRDPDDGKYFIFDINSLGLR